MKQLLVINICKVGLNLKDDLNQTIRNLKLYNIISRSVVKLSNCFKIVEKDQEIRSLAYISEFYFQKKLSKFETCSNWLYRPLRKAQIHYTALDTIMNEKNNQIMENEKDYENFGLIKNK